MFREMRRKAQALSSEETASILRRGTAGVLAVTGDDDYPYAVPISYIYDGNKLYFHCAKSGHKLDAIKRSSKASFCVVDQDQVVPKEYTTYFRSAIVFGRVRIIADDQEKLAAIKKLAIKYTPGDDAASQQMAIDQGWTSLCMLEFCIDHMSGKEAIELARQKQQKDPFLN